MKKLPLKLLFDMCDAETLNRWRREAYAHVERIQKEKINKQLREDNARGAKNL